jgi:hypothetical protein
MAAVVVDVLGVRRDRDENVLGVGTLLGAGLLDPSSVAE